MTNKLATELEHQFSIQEQSLIEREKVESVGRAGRQGRVGRVAFSFLPYFTLSAHSFVSGGWGE